ncbi:MAG: His-Xaa-Ser system radical SAM maturase HxsC [Planctomycetes bacterium]|nr:His-Xaa-Ser system radical SAM maturase HxsC [Planctomycetota bacterium]
MKTDVTILSDRFATPFDADPMVVCVTSDRSTEIPQHHALLDDEIEDRGDFAVVLKRFNARSSGERIICLPPTLHYLRSGDIIRIAPATGQIWVMYRKESLNNAIFATERCNSWCVMCSQPPKKVDDSELVNDWLKAIPLMSRETKCLGITGGEPTLLGPRLIEIIESCNLHLPQTGLHCLSNGRLFQYLTLAKSVAAVSHPDLVFGIPLYSDIASRHNYTVQIDGAFDQTLRGILNLARVGIQCEIRVVVHRHTFDRLPQLAEFIARNLPFVTHVAWMGYEPIGFGRANLNALWMDPVEYADQLAQACTILRQNAIEQSIYNHQLCVLPQELWDLSRQSISDWKNIYLSACEPCQVRQSCGGFFHSAVANHSRAIAPVL